MAEDTVEIEYQLTIDDIAKGSAEITLECLKKETFPKFLVRNIKSFLNFMFVVLIAVFFSELLTADGNNASAINAVGLILYSAKAWFIALCGFIGHALYDYCFTKKSSYKCCFAYKKNVLGAGKNKSVLALQQIFLNSTGLIRKSEFIESKVKWSAIERLKILNGDIHIFYTQESSDILPERFFKNENHRDEVFEKMVKWHSEALEKDNE